MVLLMLPISFYFPLQFCLFVIIVLPFPFVGSSTTSTLNFLIFSIVRLLLWLFIMLH